MINAPTNTGTCLKEFQKRSWRIKKYLSCTMQSSSANQKQIVWTPVQQMTRNSLQFSQKHTHVFPQNSIQKFYHGITRTWQTQNYYDNENGIWTGWAELRLIHGMKLEESTMSAHFTTTSIASFAQISRVLNHCNRSSSLRSYLKRLQSKNSSLNSSDTMKTSVYNYCF